MSLNFGSKDGILIRTMTVEDFKQIDRKIYSEEPLVSSTEKEPQDISEARQKKFDDFHIRQIEQGTCLVAINENDNGRIVGLVFAHGQVPSELEEQHRSAITIQTGQYTAEQHIMLFLCGARIKANLFERYGVSQLLFSHITYVDASMRGRGIGSRLAAALMEVGRAKGYSLMAASCTSFYSARQKEALGMECVYSEAFADYKDDKGEVVFHPTAPHTHLRIMAIKL
ncbi:hypothetical protein ACLKA7_002384 [Drosophila subpalustris]